MEIRFRSKLLWLLAADRSSHVVQNLTQPPRPTTENMAQILRQTQKITNFYLRHRLRTAYWEMGMAFYASLAI